MNARSCFRCDRHLTNAEPMFCGGCGTPIPVLIGAHPGAGVSALAAATGFHDGHPRALPVNLGRGVRLLVGRTHVAGLGFVRDALSAGHSGITRVLLVPDAPGKLPKPLRDQVAVISSVTAVTLTPWVESWRYAPGLKASKPVVTFRTALHAALTEHLPHLP